MTSHSRAVRGLLIGRSPEDPPGPLNRSMRRRVIWREIAPSPRRTPSSARGSASMSASLERNPTAPASRRGGRPFESGSLGGNPAAPRLQCQKPELLLGRAREHHDELVGDLLE